MPNTSTKHSRLHEQLQDYWQTLRGSRLMPRESEINIEAIREWWAHCFLVSVHGEKYAYSTLGADLIEAFGDDITGHEITETLLFPHPESLFNTFAEVAQNARPHTDESEFTNSRGQLIKYRSCVLPLAGEDGKSVAFLLGGMNWKAYG